MRVHMATSRSPRFIFVTRLALTFVVIVTLGVTGEDLPRDVATTNGNSSVARSNRSARSFAYAHPLAPYGNNIQIKDSSMGSPSAIRDACPVEKGYVLYNNRCLKLYTNKQDYQTATRRCKIDGAHLFNLKSREEDGSALMLLMDTMDIGGGLWVGANAIVKGHFLWSDYTPLSRDSGLWSKGKPSDSLGNEDCVEVVYHDGIELNDNTCSKKLGFVCQAIIKTR